MSLGALACCIAKSLLLVNTSMRLDLISLTFSSSMKCKGIFRSAFVRS